MFSLKEGHLDNYRKELIKELCLVDDSKYIFSAEVDHAYEDSSYDNLSDDKLAEALSKDLETMGYDLKISSIIKRTSPSSWPQVIVNNTKPMTIKQFFDIIRNVYIDEDFNYLIENCLDMFSIVKEV